MVVAEILAVVKLLDPLSKAVPPLVAANQSMVAPVAGLAEMVTVPVPHLEPAVPVGATGTAPSVATTAVLVADIQVVPMLAAT